MEGSKDNALFPQQQCLIDEMPMPRTVAERENLQRMIKDFYAEPPTTGKLPGHPKKQLLLRMLANHYGVYFEEK